MGKETGILLNMETNDLDILVLRDSNGKILQGVQIGDITKQNIASILTMHPGELKENPVVGVGIGNMLLDHDYLLYKHKIRQQLDIEGMQINHLEISGQNIQVNAEYK
ncbi:hypothetical protein [Limibacterium fermenti]|uniref:hypothetical protein n=1 Tax=Limibacterium fermenti TaxID=3229863 RepID=UPI000E8C36EE|nr:hypothetical protein [Porphyromonadaceae bacterium]